MSAITTHRVWVYGDHVNTDVIFPGKYTYTLRTQAEIAAKALEDLDSSFAGKVQAGDVIIAGKNWGNGSSREQAVTALKWSGVRMIIAESFGGLYFRNCINQGLEPVVCAGLNQVVQTGESIQIDHANNQIIANGQCFDMPALPESVRAIIDAGGLVPMLQRQFT